jgi:hypothetical protein
MLRRVVLVRTDVSEALRSSETSVFTRAKRRNISEDGIIHSHRRENLKSYIFPIWFRQWQPTALIVCAGSPDMECYREERLTTRAPKIKLRIYWTVR